MENKKYKLRFLPMFEDDLNILGGNINLQCDYNNIQGADMVHCRKYNSFRKSTEQVLNRIKELEIKLGCISWFLLGAVGRTSPHSVEGADL